MAETAEERLAALRRSRRRFRLILTISAAALIVGVAALAISITRTSAAADDAIRRANAAAVKAEAAAQHAEEAHRIADRASADLCRFLGTIRRTRIDERQTATRLYIEFRCVKILGIP